MNTDAIITPVTHSRSASCNHNKPLILCPITGYPCEGDLLILM